MRALLLLLLGFIWPLRPDRHYKPEQPVESWDRPHYAPEQPYNPHGLHQAEDFPGPNGTIVQLPWRSKIWWKGLFGDLGRVLEVRIYEGPLKGKYMRFCHLESYTGQPIGSVFDAGYAVARSDCTGRCSGPHCHIEIGKYPLRSRRFPKYRFFSYALDAYRHHRWAA